MKNIRYSFVWFIALSSFILSGLETKAKQPGAAQKGKNTKEHFYYALPQNYFTVTVKVTKTSVFEGPLSDYAGKVTGLSYLVKEDAVHYEITDISLAVHPQLDLQQVYYVEIPKKDISYCYLYGNLLLASYTNPQSSEQNKQVTPSNISLQTQNRFNIYTADAMIEKYDTTYVTQIIDTTVVQIPKISKRLVVKPTQQQAQEAINEIKKIREAYWLLISGDYETDFSNLELMLQELKQKENEYLALFGGVTEKEELSYTFTIAPAKAENRITIPLFYFSEKQGITPKGEDPHQMEYTLRLNLSNIQNIANQAKQAFWEKKSEKEIEIAKNESKLEGLYYRNPAYYSVSLYNGINLVENFGTFPIAQFGEIMSLPATIYSFEIDPLTGALLYLETSK